MTAAVNVTAWSLAAAALRRQHLDMSAETYATRRLQLVLSGVYVLGCAFRSVLPLYDVPRLCLVDTALSTVAVGRSVATVAELCFVAQWALMLRETGRATGSSVVRTVSFLILPLIAVAEICSWYAVLTTRNLGHVGENSLWGLSAALAVASMLVILPRLSAPQRRALLAWCIAGITYVAFMFLVDVPMYWSRWMADEASGRPYSSIAQGLLDVSSRCVVSHRWADWKSEVAWMSLYFSVAVWISISLIHARTPGAPAGAVKN